MKSSTAAPGVPRDARAELRLGPADTAMQGEPPSLDLLRCPLSLSGILALTFSFSILAFLRFQSSQFWYLLPLLLALAVIIVLDLRAKIIPDFVTLPGIVYSLLVAGLTASPPFLEAAFGTVTGGGILLFLAVISRGAVGGGDIKLMMMLGAALGYKGALAVLALSQLTAALIALGLLIACRATRRDTLPVGALISLFGVFTLLGRT
jgi:leader peptidase (prepilin peptidase)/N-methyltransferase